MCEWGLWVFQKLSGNGQHLCMQLTQHRRKGCTCTGLLVCFDSSLENPHLGCTGSSKNRISSQECKGDATHTLPNLDIKLKWLFFDYWLRDGQVIMIDTFFYQSIRSLTDVLKIICSKTPLAICWSFFPSSPFYPNRFKNIVFKQQTVYKFHKWLAYL